MYCAIQTVRYRAVALETFPMEQVQSYMIIFLILLNEGTSPSHHHTHIFSSSLFCLPEPSTAALSQIFSTHVIRSFLANKLSSEVTESISLLVSCAVHVYHEIRRSLLPSPVAPQYTFCTTDLAKVRRTAEMDTLSPRHYIVDYLNPNRHKGSQPLGVSLVVMCCNYNPRPKIQSCDLVWGGLGIRMRLTY